MEKKANEREHKIVHSKGNKGGREIKTGSRKMGNEWRTRGKNVKGEESDFHQTERRDQGKP